MRKMMHYRIRICPFERLISHVRPNSSVLDVGCGAGLFLALIGGTVPGIRGIGFDSSGPAIETALRMAEQAKRLGVDADLTFLRLDVGEPWPEGPFDVVSLVDVLHHVPPLYQKAVFQQAAGCLKPGGILVYKDMADKPVFHAGMNRLHDLVLARQWINYVQVADTETWARESNLELAHKESLNRFWYRHDLRVFRKS